MDALKNLDTEHYYHGEEAKRCLSRAKLCEEVRYVAGGFACMPIYLALSEIVTSQPFPVVEQYRLWFIGAFMVVVFSPVFWLFHVLSRRLRWKGIFLSFGMNPFDAEDLARGRDGLDQKVEFGRIVLDYRKGHQAELEVLDARIRKHLVDVEMVSPESFQPEYFFIDLVLFMHRNEMPLEKAAKLYLEQLKALNHSLQNSHVIYKERVIER